MIAVRLLISIQPSIPRDVGTISGGVPLLDARSSLPMEHGFTADPESFWANPAIDAFVDWLDRLLVLEFNILRLTRGPSRDYHGFPLWK